MATTLLKTSTRRFETSYFFHVIFQRHFVAFILAVDQHPSSFFAVFWTGRFPKFSHHHPDSICVRSHGVYRNRGISVRRRIRGERIDYRFHEFCPVRQRQLPFRYRIDFFPESVNRVLRMPQYLIYNNVIDDNIPTVRGVSRVT